MSAVSTTNYLPLDSDAPSVFSSIQTDNYVCVAFTILLLYDHVITLDREIEWIWTLRWRLPKFIFIINRYLLTFLVVFTNISQTLYPLSISFCKFYNYFLRWTPIFNFCAAELIMIMRVGSLYDYCKPVIWPLCGYFVAAFAATVVTQVLFIRTLYTILYYEFLPGCFSLVTGGEGNGSVQWHVWIPALSLEGTLMLLTIYKVISYHDGMNRTITVLARDSIVYFVIIFACLTLTVVNAIRPLTAVAFPILPVTQSIVSIGVGRMMMNIRGLIKDDPEHTVHLQTLQFNTYHSSGSEIEEGV